MVWGLEGVPIFSEDLQKLRTRLLNEGHGPEVSLTLACRNLNDYIRELEMTRDVSFRDDIRSGRDTLRYLQHLLGMMPKAFHAAEITFNKWIESGSSLSFFSHNETTSGSECEDEVAGNANEEVREERPREVNIHGHAWIDRNYTMEDEEEEVIVDDDEGNDG